LRLDQMLGHGREAGHILSIDSDGTIIRVRMLITDQTAAAKVRNEVYSGVIAEFDETDRLYRVGLVDSDQLAKGSGANISATIYEDRKVKDKDWKRAQKMSKSNGLPPAQNYQALKRVTKAYAPALPPAVEKALQARQLAEDAFDARPNDFTKTQFQLADAATRIAIIGASRPIAVGDGGLINFLRHGRA
jgi:hypothetical protein